MTSAEIQLLKDLLVDCDEKDITSILSEINENLLELKVGLHGIIQEKRIKLNTFLSENGSLTKQVSDLGNQIQSVEDFNKKLIKSAKQCREKIIHLSTSLTDLNSTTSFLEKLICIHNDLHQVQVLLNQKQFHDSAEIITRILDDVYHCEEFQNLVMFKNLRQEAILLRERILFEMSEHWSTGVVITVVENPDETSISISIDHEQRESLEDIIKTSFLMNETFIERRLFLKVKENILLPIVLYPSHIMVVSGERKSSLNVSFEKDRDNPSYLNVFERIIDVLKFFKTHLNVEIADDSDLISKMGQFTAHELTSTLMEQCLSKILPSQPGQLKAYGEIIANAEKLQSTLQDLNFLPSDCSPFMNPEDDVNLLFANRMYLSYLERAREIAKTDLHVTVTCNDTTVQDWTVFPPRILKLIIEKLNLNDEKQIVMPVCQISKSAQDIVNLVDSIIKEMEVNPEGRCIKSLYTIRNIFEIFSAIVPLHHRKLLDTIPQHVAIFHNNCIHFAFCLIHLAAQCQQKKNLRDHYNILLDQAVSLRQLGVQSLEDSVSNQKCQLVYILRASGLGTLNEAPKLNPDSEKAMRQCIRRLQLLRNVWGDILPTNVFTNAMSFLVDAFTEEIVNLVLAAEDISSRSATDLVDIFKIVQDRIPSIFSDAREIFRLCRKWGRFQELIFILGANLGGISERWAHGAGPLACEFSADQVKHLIRALFQNTEQRASLITKIK